MTRVFRRTGHRGNRRGAVVVLAALCMVFMLGMIAFAVDLGVIVLARTQLQCGADAAALAGVDALADGPTASQTAAQDCAQANKAGGSSVLIIPSQDILLGTWNEKACTFSALTGSAQASANAVQVTCRLVSSRGNQLCLFFGQIFGNTGINVTATAIATRSVNCGAFVGLNYVNISGGSYTDSYYSGSGSYSSGSAGSQGNVCSDGNISLSGGSTVVHGNAHPGPGDSVSATGGASVTGSTTPLTAQLTESAVNPGTAATINNNKSIPLSKFGKKALSSTGAFNLSGGDSVTLPSGTYYFASASLSGGSTITVNGATTIYVTGNINFSGGSIANTTAIPANFKLFGMGDTVTLSGSTQTYGIIYAPTADTTRSGGSSDFYGMMVGKSLTLSGGGGLHADLAAGAALGSQGSAHLVQ